MKFVRTVRAHEALNATVGDKTHHVSRTAIEVNEKDAKELEKIGAENGVALEVLDKAPDDDRAVAAVNQRPVDLSAGRAAISGGGSPVYTTDVAAGDSEVDEGDAQGDADAATTTTTTTSTTTGRN